MARPLAEYIFEKRGLIIYRHEFECPYCGRQFERGGHAEGFRKSGASNHTFACWEIGLFLRGYVIGSYRRTKPWGHFALKIKNVEKLEWGQRFIRSIQANIRKRKKDGVLHRLMPSGVC